MKELQSIHSNNIRIAKKLEELGFYKEADRVDNVNLIVSQKIVLAKGPFDYNQTGPRIDRLEFGDGPARAVSGAFNVKAFMDGIAKAYQKLSGKAVSFAKFTPFVQRFNVALGNIFGYGAILGNVGLFLIRLSQDQSGTIGDSPKEIAEIVSNLAGVVSGIGMISAAGGGGPWAVALAGVAGLIQAAINIYLQVSPDGLEDEFDYGRNNYPGRGAQALIQDAYDKLYPGQNRSYNLGKDKLTDLQKRQLQDKIVEIAKAKKIKGKVVVEAFALIAQNSNQAPMKKEDMGRHYGLVKKPEKPGVFGNPEIDIPVY
jgi:hypothetical protein